ncbi:MAG: DUF2298 domain-containing protein [Candidatus Hinthialibacter antarcticus]|nr:DUF2298 domain-containing protein [Candidatus Hinthialibacter antarcticus]
MYTAEKRILSAIALLVIFGVALFLRFDGLDWAYKDGAYSFHPDERHVESCVNQTRPQGLSAEELNLPLRQKVDLLVERNLKVDPNRNYGPNDPDRPGLKPVNYNYGTLPNHLYLLARTYFAQSYIPAENEAKGEWVFLNFPDAFSLFALGFVLLLGLSMYWGLCRDLKTIEASATPWYLDPRRLFYFMPCLLLPFIGLFVAVAVPQIAMDFSHYDPERSSVLIIGRMVTAWAGAFTVLIVYLIGRNAYNPLTGLIGAAFLATAMVHVQCSHFATVDVILGFFATAAIYAMLRLAQTGRLHWYLLSAVCVAFAVATKWSGLVLLAPLFIAQAIVTMGGAKRGVERWVHLFWLLVYGLFFLFFIQAARSTTPPFNETIGAFWSVFLSGLWWMLPTLVLAFGLSLYLLRMQMIWDGRYRGWLGDAWRVYKPWLWFELTGWVGFAAFFIGEPMAFYDAKQFAADIAAQAAMHTSGASPVWFTLQYNNTIPFFTSLDNLFYPSLDWLTATLIFLGCIYALWKVFVRPSREDLFLTAFVVPTFILLSTFHSKFPRYQLLILPVMAVLGARLCVDIMRLQPMLYSPEAPWFGPRLKRWTRRAGTVFVCAALLCGLVYGCAYVGVYDHPHTLVQATQYLRETMGPRAKVYVNNVDEGVHLPNLSDIGFHYAGPPGNDINAAADYYAQRLSQADYLVFRSKRPYGSTLQNPETFSAVNQFLRVLFSEQLGFRVDKVITQPPRFMGWEFRVDEEDESARIYDHPKVIIFKRTQNLDQKALTEAIIHPPDWVNEISASEILRLRDGAPVFSKPQTFPVLRWWIALFVLGWIGFLLLFPLCTALPDRGYGVARAAGIALFSWLCWVLASTRVFPVSGVQFAFVLALLLIAAGVSAYLNRAALCEFFKKRAILLLSLELLFLVVWAVFLSVRAYHPAAAWGEKPMNFSFINAIYRAEAFPPEDPWISGEPVNYYYYGHMLFSLVGRAAGVQPEYLFNVGGSSIAGLVALGVFSLIFAMTRRAFLSLFGVYLYLFSAHLLSFFQYVNYAVNHKAETAAVLGNIASGAWTVMAWMFTSSAMYLGVSSPDATAPLLQFDRFDLYGNLFWAISRVVPDTVANEFPYWTHLFMDFHAHMLVVPFTLVFLAIAYAMLARPLNELDSGRWTGFVFWMALMLGTVTCTNTWDLPGLAIVLMTALAIKFWRESSVANSKTYIEWTAPSTWLSLARMPGLPVFSTLVLSYALLYPFHFWFVSRVNSVGVMAQGQTSPYLYVFFWGHLLFPIAIAAVLLASTRRSGGVSLLRTALFGFGFIVSLASAILISKFNLFGFPSPLSETFAPLNYEVVGLFLPFLVVLFFCLWNRQRSTEQMYALLLGFVGLGLSLGIEIFYINEGRTPPTHRWNTVFKFNLQTWLYFSLFAPVACLIVWQCVGFVGKKTGMWFAYLTRFGFISAYACVLLLTLPFTVVAPAVVMFSGGAAYRDARGDLPTLDGLSWLKVEHYPDYAVAQWLKRFAPGTPRIAEMPDGYYNQVSRFCTTTGLPGMLGWSNHVGERMHYDKTGPRRRDADQIYLSGSKKQVRQILDQYNIQYVLFGEMEMNYRRDNYGRFTSYGIESLKRLESMGDILQLQYRYEDSSIFEVRRDLNAVYEMDRSTQVPDLPPALRPPEEGMALLAGQRGEGNGMFMEPRGLAVDGQGKVFVADTFNHRVQVFQPDGAYAWQVGDKGDGASEFNEPNALSIDPESGNFFIADTWNGRVVLLNKDGSYIGATPAIFYGPRGILYHPQTKLVYICNTGRHLIQLMQPNGDPAGQWGVAGGGDGDEAFREPIGIALTPAGEVAICDTRNTRVKIYSPQGQFLRQWPIQTTWTEEAGGFESHLACAADGAFYVTDPFEGCVHVYSPDGELLRKITHDLEGRSLGKPVGILCLPDGKVLITDISVGLSGVKRVE